MNGHQGEKTPPGSGRRGNPRRKRRLLFLAGALALIQLVRLPRPGPQLRGDGPWTRHMDVPSAVEGLVGRACYDCHSGETRWPWYSRVAPISWLILHDVRHGRSNLDFSQWSTDPVAEPTPTQRLTWICEETRDGIMPPLVYRIVHAEARLSESEVDTLCRWTRTMLGGKSQGLPPEEEG